MSRKSTGRHFVSPVIMGGYVKEVEDDGDILKTLAGVGGTLIGGSIVTDKMPKDSNMTITLSVENRDGSGKSEQITNAKGTGELETNIPVSATSKISITTDCIGAKGVWVAIAILPNVVNKLVQEVQDDEPGVSLPTRTKAVTRRN